jgi:predicted nucleotidyltransferase
MGSCSNKTHRQFDDIVAESEKDDDIIALVLTGSRGKDFEHELSDYDIWMVTQDKRSAENLELKYDNEALEAIDLCIMSLDEFKDYAYCGGPEEWDRYDFTHCKILVDKGDIAQIVKEKGSLPENVRDKYITDSLDCYINQVFRSVKCFRDGEDFGARLEANMGIAPMLDALYALEGRPRPFFRYLKLEIKNFPLQNFPWRNDGFVDKVSDVLATGDLEIQQDLLKTMEKIFRSTGYAKVFDDWEGKDKWAMEFKS